MKVHVTKVLAGFGALGIVAALVGLLVMIVLVRSGFSARPAPSSLEARLALTLRKLAIPNRYGELQNPVAPTPSTLEAAMEHWADHCAGCHANDGSGHTTMGQHMYPRAPDMRDERTQQMTDGELYWIINQGIRFTGMPAWGISGDDDRETWALVQFIRTLPTLTREQIERMKSLNPIPAAAREARQEEDDFLSGESEHTDH